MGRRGRYGKYGEVKRIKRLRKAKRESVSSTPGDSRFSSKGKSRRKRERPGKGVRIRQSMPEDAEFVRRLSKGSFGRYGPYEGLLPDWLDKDYALSFVAVRKGTPVGFAMVSRASTENYLPPMSELLAIAVHPGLRRKGIGGLLVKETIRRALEEGTRILILHVAAENFAGQALFRKYGFVRTQLKESFYPQGQNALMMVMNLAEEQR